MKLRDTTRKIISLLSGLQVVCFEYVAFQQFAPEQNIGFALSAEYKAAVKLLNSKKQSPAW